MPAAAAVVVGWLGGYSVEAVPAVLKAKTVGEKQIHLLLYNCDAVEPCPLQSPLPPERAGARSVGWLNLTMATEHIKALV